MRKPGVELDLFVKRMRRIGIEIRMGVNVPWVYLEKINGKKVKEVRSSNYGYNIAWFPNMVGSPLKWADMDETFNLIRKYTGRKEKNCK